jgi:hypothetical protein
MKGKAGWKPLGHSAKRWHGTTPRNEQKTTPRETRPHTRREFSSSPTWK